MPGIDFAALRREISIGEVLDLLAFHPIRCTPSQLRGACPFDCQGSPRDFAAYLESNRFYCYHCRRGGNQLDLWAQTQDLPIWHAAVDLCDRLGIDPPLIHRW
jgi:DNA primase